MTNVFCIVKKLSTCSTHFILIFCHGTGARRSRDAVLAASAPHHRGQSGAARAPTASHVHPAPVTALAVMPAAGT